MHIIGPPSHWSPISLVPHLIGPPSHWFPISLVPHLIGPLLIDPPIHKSPTTLFELIGPPTHWSPFSLVHPFSVNPNGPPSQWSPISLVPHLIGPPISTHAPPIPLDPHLIGPGPHPIGPFSPVGPPIHKSPPHCLNSMAPFSLIPPCNPFYPVLIGPPSHWSPNATLITQFSLVPHFIGLPV